MFVFDSSNIFQFMALLKWCKNWKISSIAEPFFFISCLQWLWSKQSHWTWKVDILYFISQVKQTIKKKINFSTYLFDQTFRLLFNISGYNYDVILLNEGKKIWIWKARVFPRTKVRSPLNTLNWGEGGQGDRPLPPEIRKNFEIRT